MALLSPTFLFGIAVVLYLSSFVVFAVLRFLTGISIQRIGYFSLRRLAYTPRDGFKIEVRGLGLNVHRPTFAQPTWLSIVVSELVVTLDIAELEKQKAAETGDETVVEADDGDGAAKDEKVDEAHPKRPALRHAVSSSARSQTWKRLMKVKDRIKRLQRNIHWLRMVDVVATNSTINVVDVGSIQFGHFTIAVDTRRKMVDRARFFLQPGRSQPKEKRQAEWIVTLRSVLFTPEGRESLEVLDNATLNIHGFVYEAMDGLRDTAIALKLGRLHIPYDDVMLCAERYKACKATACRALAGTPEVDMLLDKAIHMQELDEGDAAHADLMQAVSDSKEFGSSILRGIKEVQFAVSFAGVSKRVHTVSTGGSPVVVNASMKEVGIDLQRLDPKSPAHRMYFPSKDIAHEALAAALSISVGVDDGNGKPERIVYIPMATTTVKTTLPSKTVELGDDISAEERNANILFANSVVTSPSVDLDPRHLPLVLALLSPRPKAHKVQPSRGYMVISRLLPKANVKFTMHEPVVRISLPPVNQAADADDFDLLISSISSISLDLESFHPAVEDQHYSLASSMRLQSHKLYYQTNAGVRFDVLQTESFDLKINLSASPAVQVWASGNLETFTIRLVRPEISNGLRQIVRQLRLNVEPDMRASPRHHHANVVRDMPDWLFHFHMQATDFRAEVAGVDEDLSDESRGVAILLDTWTAEYTARRDSLGAHRRPVSRRRANSRATDSLALPPSPPGASSPGDSSDVKVRMPVSPRARHQTAGDGRRIAIHGRVLEAYLVESEEKWEVEPFVRVPRFEVGLSTATDSHGPVFHVQCHAETLLVQYSLYRHYAVGLATMVLRNAFPRTRSRDRSAPDKAPAVDHLAPPSVFDSDGAGEPGRTVKEMTTTHVKINLLQVKASMPNDPSVLLQIYGLQSGRHRYAPPYFHSRLIRLCSEAPRMRNVWARMVSIKNGRMEYRASPKKKMGASGHHQEERMVDVVADAIRVAVPHETIVHKISDNFINVFKSVQQLHHRFKTGTNEYILEKGPEGPKRVPRVSLRTHTFLFELEDGGFEWKLGMIYRAGRVEQMHRLAREEAFNIKIKKMHEEETRHQASKARTSRSAKGTRRHEGRKATVASHWLRSRSEDGRSGGRHGRDRRGDDHRGRRPRYNPEEGIFGLTGHAQVRLEEARAALDELNAASWRSRIDRYYVVARDRMKELRGLFWGLDQLPDEVEDTENILEVPQRPALLSALIMDLQLVVDKPSFLMEELADFLHKTGKGMPKDMQYGLLVPMHVTIDLGEARVSLRDYPLPLLHVPAVVGSSRSGSGKAPALSLRTDFVIAEEFRGIESTRRVKVNIIPPRDPDQAHGSRPNEGSFAIDVRRTIGPVKSYSDVRVDINTSLPTRITWGPSYQPAIQDMMMVIESFTKPQLDPSERVGFWDKIRLNFHSRIRVAWTGDGDVHLALKGTRDPYQVVGNGAGLLMCWRGDVRWSIHATDDPKEFMVVDSAEYVLAVPDYGQQAREAQRRMTGEMDHPSSDEEDGHGANDGSGPSSTKAAFRKVVMKLSGRVQWLAGLVFERAIGEDGQRSFDFVPHYDVVLKAPHFAHSAPGEPPYDAFRGFRSQHIHLSLAVRAPADRDWTIATDGHHPSRSYNSVHLTPRFFTHFFAWWSLFGGPMSLPIRQGTLWPGREKNSKKFGRHLATIKYGLLLSPLFLSHIYKHKDAEDHASSTVSATGLKVRFDGFMLDLHQRREEFNTRDRGRKTQSRTTGMKIHAAQLDLTSADVRAVSATLVGTTPDALLARNAATTPADHDHDEDDLSRFTIPDNDFSWIDMDDFVELDWILPHSESNPDTKILPLAYAPRITYFRQTDIGGVIAGDPGRTSPFGHEPTHVCIMSQDDDPRRVQAQLIRERLAQLARQMEAHSRTADDAEQKASRHEGEPSEEALEELETILRNSMVLEGKKAFLENMLRQMTAQQPTSASVGNTNDTQIKLDGGGGSGDTMQLPSGAEFASEFKNRFVVHNMQLKWNNLLRNIVLRYIHQVSQRRGFVYYLSRPAVKFILDIVEEQAKAKAANSGSGGDPSVPSTAPSGVNVGAGGGQSGPGGGGSDDKSATKDIEDKIKRILQEGHKFVGTDDSTSSGGDGSGDAGTTAAATGVPPVSMEDLTAGIADEFTPQSSYHVRVIAPQMQLQSDKNKKHVVLVTAKGMELKVVEVMDKARISDVVSGLVQRRFMVNMDSTQFFVTHQKWFTSQLQSSMYSGSTYGTPAGSAWPPWVPMEIMFDFKADPFGFRRVVQKTSATLRYDKYNTLRLKYNDEVSRSGGEGSSATAAKAVDPAESRMDSLWVEFPRAHALCNSSQYYAMYVIVLDLLMWNEPLEKTRSERLEKIMLASDFSDLRGAPEKVCRLQERIRKLEDIRTHFQTHARYFDPRSWEDRILLDRDLAACEDELFFTMKAITTSQRRAVESAATTTKDSTQASSNPLLRWSIAAGDIVWHLIRDDNSPLVELQLKGVEYHRTDNADGSHINLLRVGSILGLNLLPDSVYPTMIAPYLEAGPSVTGGGTPSTVPVSSGDKGAKREMIRVYWYMLEAIAGIPVMDHFEVNLFPLKVQLEREVGKQLFEYIFPGTKGLVSGDDKGSNGGAGNGLGLGKNDSPFMLKQRLPGQIDESEGEDESMSGSVSQLADRNGNENGASGGSSAFSTRPGSLELRLRPTLTLDPVRPSTSSSPGKHKSHNVHGGSTEGSHGHGSHGFRFFRSVATPGSSHTASKRPSFESLRDATVKPGVGRTGTGFSSKAESTHTSDSKKARFALRGRAGTGMSSTAAGSGGAAGGDRKEGRNGKHKQHSDDLTMMMTRASNYMTFAYIKMPSVVLCLSYKGKGERNLEDVHDLVFKLPTIEHRNKTWSNLDLALALKSRVIKALISHTGAIISNKISRHHHRPHMTPQSRLREIASSSVLLSYVTGTATGSSPTANSAPGGTGIATPASYSTEHLGTVLAASPLLGPNVAGLGGTPSLDSRDNSDDSSSMYGTSPILGSIDYSRSPPKRRATADHQQQLSRLHTANANKRASVSGASVVSADIPGPPRSATSRSSSVASSLSRRSFRQPTSGGSGSGSGTPGGGINIPAFLTMTTTPPTPLDERPTTESGTSSGSKGLGISFSRPKSIIGGGGSGSGLSSLLSSARPGSSGSVTPGAADDGPAGRLEKRKSTGGSSLLGGSGSGSGTSGFLKSKLSSITQRLKDRDGSGILGGGNQGEAASGASSSRESTPAATISATANGSTAAVGEDDEVDRVDSDDHNDMASDSRSVSIASSVGRRECDVDGDEREETDRGREQTPVPRSVTLG